MDYFNPFTLIVFSTGLVFIIGGRWMSVRPPAKINHLVGYRTGRSMVGQEEWDFAQLVSAARMERIGWIECMIGAFWLVVPGVGPIVESLIATMGVIASCVLLIVHTENELKNRFG